MEFLACEYKINFFIECILNDFVVQNSNLQISCALGAISIYKSQKFLSSVLILKMESNKMISYVKEP